MFIRKSKKRIYLAGPLGFSEAGRLFHGVPAKKLIGYAFARGKPIIGYRGDLRLSSDNVGLTVNLQVEFFIRESGGEILSNASAIPAALG